MAADVDVVPATPERWGDLVELFERPGPRGGRPETADCWCMWWRQRTGDRDLNKAAMAELVSSGARPGLLAYRDGIAVGWVAVAARSRLGQLQRSRTLRPADDGRVWSITCFFVDRRSRGSGVTRQLLDGAVAFAGDAGAHAVEAYPSELGDYMGSRALFQAAGFRPVRQAGRRTVVRLDLRAASPG